MKRLIYRFAIWLEYRALDLQSWSEPETPQYNLNELIVSGINQQPVDWWKNNALINHLMDKRD